MQSSPASLPAANSSIASIRFASLVSLVTVVTVALAALSVCSMSCADDAVRIGPPDAANPPRSPPSVTPTIAADAAGPALTTVDVGGRVVDDLGEAVIARSLTLVDRRGRRREILTDEEGGFHVMGVVPPYDLVVAPSPSAAVITPLVFFGLSRADPRLEVFERSGPTLHPQSQPIRVGVKLPACHPTAAACWVSVISASASGGGATAGSYTGGPQTASYEVDHAWREATLRPGESVAVHVLVGDAQYTEYAYARLLHISARPGEPTDVGMTVPLSVDASDPVSVAGRATAQPEGWQWTLASVLDLPGGASFGLRYEWAAATAMRLPKLPGATWHVGAWVQHPQTPEHPYFYRSSQAWSGTLPLTATNVSLDVPMAPEPLRPTMEGAISRRGIGLAWKGGAPALASVVLVDIAHGQQRFRAFTSDAELPLQRLEALGVPRPEAGDHVLDLTTTPGATVDELTQPDERLRRHRFDPGVPGATTYQRFHFKVTR